MYPQCVFTTTFIVGWLILSAMPPPILSSMFIVSLFFCFIYCPIFDETTIYVWHRLIDSFCCQSTYRMSFAITTGFRKRRAKYKIVHVCIWIHFFHFFSINFHSVIIRVVFLSSQYHSSIWSMCTTLHATFANYFCPFKCLWKISIANWYYIFGDIHGNFIPLFASSFDFSFRLFIVLHNSITSSCVWVVRVYTFSIYVYCVCVFDAIVSCGDVHASTGLLYGILCLLSLGLFICLLPQIHSKLPCFAPIPCATFICMRKNECVMLGRAAGGLWNN